MTLGFLFWLLMLLAFIFNGWWNWPSDRANYGPFGGSMFVFVLLFILGWRVFGFVIQG